MTGIVFAFGSAAVIGLGVIIGLLLEIIRIYRGWR